MAGSGSNQEGGNLGEKDGGDGPETIERPQSGCAAIAGEGITSANDVIRLMSASIKDVLDGTITATVATVLVNATGKMLKAAELQVKYGQLNERKAKQLIFLDASTR